MENGALFSETTVKSVWYDAYNNIWRFCYSHRRAVARKISLCIHNLRNRINRPTLVIVEPEKKFIR